jgi:hypothetical protein
MKKYLCLLPLLMAVFTFLVLNFLGFGPKKITNAAIDTATLSTTVLEYLSFSLTAGDEVTFGNLTPGTAIFAPATGTVGSVSTNAANGYTLGIHDGVAAPNSSMLHTDESTRIPKMTNGTIATPVTWGTNTGVGITLYAADTSKNAKWGTGTTYNDANNKYAAIPEGATTAHTVTGTVSGADTSSWAFGIDVSNSQKTGSYSGDVTFTATAVLL